MQFGQKELRSMEDLDWISFFISIQKTSFERLLNDLRGVFKALSGLDDVPTAPAHIVVHDAGGVAHVRRPVPGRLLGF